MGERAEATGKRRLTGTGSVGGDKRRTVLCGKTSRAARLLHDVAIEDVEELRPEVDHRSLCDLGLLPNRDVLISSTERARTGQSSRLIAKSEGIRKGKGIRIEEGRSERVQIPAI